MVSHVRKPKVDELTKFQVLSDSTLFWCAFSFISISFKKEADIMKSKYELYLEMEKWYKKQERKAFIKYYITNLFKR